MICAAVDCGDTFTPHGGGVTLCRTCGDKLDANIAALHEDGLSYQTIAERLGITKSAVKGRAVRARLQSKQAAGVKAQPLNIAAPLNLGTVRKSNEGTLLGFTLPGVCHPVVQMPIAPARECQWPLNSGRPWSFCCKPVVAKSFCAGHYAIACLPNRPKLVADAA